MTLSTKIAAALCLPPLLSQAYSEELSPKTTIDLEPIVVTSTQSSNPGQVTFDPTIAIQPLPANDGADALRHIAGISVIRKGGTDGDPTFRGMAGSRLPVILDGVSTLGGCGQRMDPPTAYVFPSSFDKVTVLKGPQSVRYGPGSSAGVILFERQPPRLNNDSASLQTFATVASFNRYDLSVETLVGNASVYGRFQGSWSESGDYEDGDGNVYNSEYKRWNTQTALGWTPNENSALEFSVSLSDGEAAYADRGMDGVKFDRTAYQLRYRIDQLDGALRSIDAQAYHSYVDHVMDNFTLREFTPTMMMSMPMVSNPDRLTEGGSVSFELDRWHRLDSSLGFDLQTNQHRLRNAMGAAANNYESLAYTEDANFEQYGLFGEFGYELEEGRDLKFGFRLDNWHAEDLREMIRVGMNNRVSNPTAGEAREDTLTSGYLRYEQELNASNAKFFAGIGHSERFPDYWELFSKESANSVTAFGIDPEKVTQLDLGVLKRFGDFNLNASLYYADHQNFILIESNFSKTTGTMTRTATVARNVDATTYGGEIELRYQNDHGWYAGSTLAYTRGENDSDTRPLGQIPPLEMRIEGGKRSDAWSGGWILRLVDDQDRIAINQGNIVGQDIGESEGFAVLSFHSSYRINEYWDLSAGVDNAFDTTYAEHISRAGTLIAGYDQTIRVNEPGRTLWARFSAKF